MVTEIRRFIQSCYASSSAAAYATLDRAPTAGASARRVAEMLSPWSLCIIAAVVWFGAPLVADIIVSPCYGSFQLGFFSFFFFFWTLYFFLFYFSFFFFFLFYLSFSLHLSVFCFLLLF
jgi:hypothetical protein